MHYKDESKLTEKAEDTHKNATEASKYTQYRSIQPDERDIDFREQCHLGVKHKSNLREKNVMHTSV